MEAAKGLLIHGTITGRTRRAVGKENPRTERDKGTGLLSLWINYAILALR